MSLPIDPAISEKYGHSTLAWPGHWTRERDPEPQPPYRCFTKECGARVWHEEQLPKCEKCGQRFCSDCRSDFPDGKHTLSICLTCCVCDVCEKFAHHMCEECGDLLCDAHIQRVEGSDSTGYREDVKRCRGGCEKKTPEAVPVADVECPF